MNAQQPFTTTLAYSNIKNFRYEWIWEKPQGTNPLNAKVTAYQLGGRKVEFKAKPIYNPQMWISTPYSGFKNHNKKIGEVYGNIGSQHRDNPTGERYPKSILKFKQEKGFHPTQKPVKMMEYMIKTYTNEGHLVLDSTMGSGTTGVACVNPDRNFIGIDLKGKYFEVSKSRIKKAQNTILKFT